MQRLNFLQTWVSFVYFFSALTLAETSFVSHQMLGDLIILRSFN